jgi:hypothetical protein
MLSNYTQQLMKRNKKLYFISISALVVLLAFPLIYGIREVFFGAAVGPEPYAEPETRPGYGLSVLESMDSSINGCYLAKGIYLQPLSSSMLGSNSSYVYFDGTTFYTADTRSGTIQKSTVEYCNKPVSADEFTSKTDFMPEIQPDIAHFKERYHIASMSG